MALPVLQGSGNTLALSGGGMLLDRDSAEESRWRDGMAAAVQAMYNTLVDILDVQRDILAVLRGDVIDKDTREEKGNLKDTSPETKQKTSMFDGLKNIQAQAGGFISALTGALLAAALLWGNHLEAYVTSVLMPAIIKKFLVIIKWVSKFVGGIRNLFTAVFDDIGKIINWIGTKIPKTAAKITGTFDAIGNFFLRIKEAIKTFALNKWNSAWTAIKNFFNSFGIIEDIITNFKFSQKFGTIKKIGDFIGRRIDNVVDFYKSVSGLFGRIKQGSETFKLIGSFFSNLFKAGDTISKIIAPVMKFIKSIGPKIGRILWPIQILMSVFDFVKGFTETEGNIVEKFIGGITEVFVGLFIKPLDLLKKLLSWVAGDVLGFEGFSEWLESFSLADMFRDMIQSVVDFVKKAIDVIKNPWKSIKSLFGIGDDDEAPKTGSPGVTTNADPTGRDRTKFSQQDDTSGGFARPPTPMASSESSSTASGSSSTSSSKGKKPLHTIDRNTRLRYAKALEGQESEQPGTRSLIRQLNMFRPTLRKGWQAEDIGGGTIQFSRRFGKRQQPITVTPEMLSGLNSGGDRKNYSPQASGMIDNTNAGPIGRDRTGFSQQDDTHSPLTKSAWVPQNATKNISKFLGGSLANANFKSVPTVPSTVTAGMSAEAKARDKTAGNNIVNAPTTNVTNNTTNAVNNSSGSGGGTNSRSNSNPSERRAPMVNVGIRG